MNKSIYFLGLFLPIMGALNTPLGAQAISDTTFVLIYQLSDKQAESCYKVDSLIIDPAFLGAPIDSSGQIKDWKAPSPGHYVWVWAYEGQVTAALKSYTSLRVDVSYSARHLLVQVFDTLGGSTPQAQVFFKDKLMPYNKELGIFELPKQSKNGILRVSAGQQTAFFYLDNEGAENPPARQRWRRLIQSTPAFILLSPYRLLRQTYRFVARVIRGRGWYFGRIFPPAQGRPFQGYLVLSKPRYLPGDTVKMSAQVARKNGRPLRRRLEFSLGYSHANQYFTPLKKQLKPSGQAGAYQYEWVLPDSLPLNIDFSASLQIASKDEKGVFGNFEYEDYQLDEVVYALKPDTSVFTQGDPVILQLSGKDKNDFPVTGGSARLSLLTKTVHHFFDTLLVVPDTLWTHYQEFDESGTATIMVPDTIWPLADLDVNVQAQFSNDKGELQSRSCSFSYQIPKAQLSLVGNSLVGTWAGKHSNKLAAKLLWQWPDLPNEGLLSVDLPFQIPINPSVKKYTLKVNGVSTGLNMATQTHSVKINGWRKADSLWVEWSNVRNLTIGYRIFDHKAIVAEGQFKDANFTWQGPADAGASIRVESYFIWGGISRTEREEIQLYPNLLEISSNQLQKITPGATTPIELSVVDFKGRPVKKAHLSAGAINAQFNSYGNFEAAEVRYKEKKDPIAFGNYKAKALVFLKHTKPLDRVWYQALHLKKELFYRLLFEGDGVFMHRDTLKGDSFYQKIAQFAPYVVKNGRFQPIYLIYCNRKLVYSYDVSDDPPYSFAGMEGLNTITIRTRNAEYTLADVQLFRGQKLEFSIDEDRWQGAALLQKISYKPMPVEWTPQEKSLLNEQLFVLTKTEGGLYYVWSDSSSIHRINLQGSRTSKLGPFTPGDTIHYLVQNGFQTHFSFEAGYAYEVYPKRERLYAVLPYSYQNKFELSPQIKPRTPGAYVLCPADIIARVPEIPLLQFSERPEWSRAAGMAGLTIKRNTTQADSSLLAVVLKNEADSARVFSPGTLQWVSLPPGKYSLWLISASGQYFAKRAFLLKANSHTYLDLGSPVFQADLQNFILGTLLKNKIKTKKPIQPAKRPDLRGGGYQLSGVIQDESGEPLIGAAVLVKESNLGTVADVDGHYSLNLPPGSYTIAVYYTGFQTQEIENVIVLAGYGNNMDVTLHEGTELSEVVVTAYGYSRRRQQAYYYSPSALLAGKTPGVSVKGSRSDLTNYYIDGVRVLQDENNLPLAPVALRTDFRDEAYWKPNLITNRKGKAYFSVTYPENITAWNTYVLGMDNKGRSAVKTGQVQAYKPLVAQLAVPRFLVRGDEATVIGTLLNFGSDSLSITAKFDGAAETNQVIGKSLTLKSALAPAAAQQDTVLVQFTAQSAQGSDGEQRKIPLVARGVEETLGGFWLLEGDTSFTISLDQGTTPVQIYAEDNLLPAMLKDLEQLRAYPYDCNEQASSKLTGLLLERDIRKRLGQPFSAEREKEIGVLISKLSKAQHPDGGWGWWPGNEIEPEMNLYVLEALSQADSKGYSTPAFERGMRRLSADLPRQLGRDLLQTLGLMAEIGQTLDYESQLKRLRIEEPSIYERLLMLRIRQLRGLPHTLDSLFVHEQRTLMGGSFWGQFSKYDLFSNEIACTLLAYKIAKHAGNEALLKRIRHYFMEKKGSNGWRNTIESAQILSVLLSAQNQETSTLPASLEINGVKVSLPYQAAQADGQNTFELRSQGLGTIYLTAYRQWLHPEPQRQIGAFELSTQLEQNNRPVENLQTGQAAKLLTTIEVKEQSQYVMIEVPIPAGCSYLQTNQAGWNSLEVHREYRRDRVSIFCLSLPPGRHTFTVELEPRFTGRYSLNPAKAELMYFPTFFGREGMKELRIKE